MLHKIMRKFLYTLLYLVNFQSITYADSLRWDWQNICTSSITLPENFLFGVATSSYQVEGGNTNVWDRWAAQGNCHQAAGEACDAWNRYQEDAQLIQQLGANSYRMSVEWSRIEPQQGIFDEQALDHYAAICDELRMRGIAPVITLHHYNDPIWFADSGGFEREENIKYYVRFAKKVIDHLHDKVHLWLTFNSPASYAAKAYQVGMMPPGKKDMQLMAAVLKNVLEAHVQLYMTVKKDPLCAHAQVGTLHNIMQVEPSRTWHPLDNIVAYMADCITHRCVYRFFTTGVFKFFIPTKAYVYHENLDAPQSLDFIGLNYYSHGMMRCELFGQNKGAKLCPHSDEMTTQCKEKTVYPEGLYRAIKEISQEIAQPLHIPIYITENGIAPHKDEDRDLFLRRYLYAMFRAISEGCDVRGYFYWSLMDNYEWGSLGKKRYGLYRVDFSTQQRTLKPSARYFIQLARRFGKPLY